MGGNLILQFIVFSQRSLFHSITWTDHDLFSLFVKPWLIIKLCIILAQIGIIYLLYCFIKIILDNI
jgi:hypothetical protein